jgi:peptide-methionine (S)-S-oxide reductase
MLKALVVSTLLLTTSACGEETTRALPLPQQDVPGGDGLQSAVLAGGCFWGIQGVFQHVNGVKEVVSGYSGGAAETARYSAVERGNTGHAEAVRVTYDPRQVSYGRLLQVYFSVMDPTSVNRQGPDQGSQYRSEIFAADPAQARVASAYIAQLAGARAFSRPIATRVSGLRGFYPAEAYHQDYLIRNPNAPYIVVNDLPKIDKLKALYPNLYSAHPIAMAQR